MRILAFLSLIMLTGCLQSQVIDDISLIQTVSIDKGKKNKLKYTVAYPSFVEQGKESEIGMENRTIMSETPEEARSLLNSRSQKPLRYGQLRVVLFGSDIAEEGIEKYVKSFYRNPRIGNRIFLAVSEGEAGQAIKFDGGVKKRIGMYFSDLIEHNMDYENIPVTNMHLFLFDLYSDGRDAFLPLIKRDKDQLRIEGLAMFDHDKLVKKLTMEEAFIFKILLRGSDKGTSQFVVPDKNGKAYVVIQNILSKVTYRETSKNPVPTYDVTLTMRGEITDQTGEFQLDNKKDIKIIERNIQKQIQAVSRRLIKQFQEKKIDPLAFGDKYKSKTRNWNPETWKDTLYPEMKVNVNVDLEILQSGAIE